MYCFIDEKQAARIKEFFEYYWQNPDSQPEDCPIWLDEKGIIKMLEEIVRLYYGKQSS